MASALTVSQIQTAPAEDVAHELATRLRALRGGTLRPAAGNLLWPYLIPGSYAQAWDWDSYFIGLALADWPEAWPHLRGTVENFFAHMDAEGRMPRWVHPERSFWESGVVGTTFGRDLAKPFFAQLALVYSEATGDFAWFKQHLESERKFLETWRRERMSEAGLYVWANGLESGGDNHPDVFGWPPFSVEGVDLAVFLIREHLAAAVLAYRAGEYSHYQYFWSAARFLEHQMTAALFDRGQGRFANRHRPTGQLIAIQTQTAFYPLWLGEWLTLGRDECRTIIERDLLDPARFFGDHGVRSLRKGDPAFNNTVGVAPSNWQGPIWLVSNYIHLCSLICQGFKPEAIALAARLQRLLLRDLVQRGEMAECYHSETGAPLAVPGFLSWNLLGANFLADAQSGTYRSALPLTGLRG
jgi:glycogen debranching enzyme